MTDNVNNPAHYTKGAVETIDLIAYMIDPIVDPHMAFCMGNAIKYIARAPFKNNKVEDLKKALWYLNRVILYPMDRPEKFFNKATDHMEPWQIFALFDLLKFNIERACRVINAQLGP